MTGLEIWAIVTLCLAVVLGVIACRLGLLADHKYRYNREKRRQLVVGMWSSLALTAIFMFSFLACFMRSEFQYSNHYTKKCHDRGGVVTHGSCFKPGSEIKI